MRQEETTTKRKQALELINDFYDQAESLEKSLRQSLGEDDPVVDRCIQEQQVDLIPRFGTPVKKEGDTVEYRLRKRDTSKIVQVLDKAIHKAILVSGDGQTIDIWSSVTKVCLIKIEEDIFHDI